jgi:hypothetical protein
MPINPAYRDFFMALGAIERGVEVWAAYERFYLTPHRQVLAAYWRQCWDADDERIRELVREIRPGDYRALREAIESADLERLAEDALQRCARLVDLPEPQVDLLVGRFSPDGFLFDVAGEWHIGVGLERFAHFSTLPLFIAHEYGHYARRMLAPEPVTLADFLVAEGIAVAFGHAAYPELPLARHLRLTPRRIHEIRELEPVLWETLRPSLDSRDMDVFAGVLHGARRWRGFPPRFGTCLGYWAVGHFAEGHGASAADRGVLSADSTAVVDEYFRSSGTAPGEP